MGIHLVNAVVNGLKGRDFKRPNSKQTLNAEKLAFFVVIANRQPNPGTYGLTDTICYGDPNTLCELMHMSKSQFHKVRNYLVSLGLISYKPQEELADIDGNGETRKYTNTYRIQLKVLRDLFAPDDDATWQNSILQVSDKEFRKMTADVRRALFLPAKPVSNGDPTVSNGDPPVSNGDTNKNNNKIKNKKTTTTGSMSSAGGGIDEIWFGKLVKRIADVCLVQEYVVLQPLLRKIVAGKSHKAIDRCISDFDDEHSRSDLKALSPKTRVGRLVARFKDLPAGDDAADKQIVKAQFASVPKTVIDPEDAHDFSSAKLPPDEEPRKEDFVTVDEIFNDAAKGLASSPVTKSLPTASERPQPKADMPRTRQFREKYSITVEMALKICRVSDQASAKAFKEVFDGVDADKAYKELIDFQEELDKGVHNADANLVQLLLGRLKTVLHRT